MNSKQIVFAYIPEAGIVRDLSLNFLPDIKFNFDSKLRSLTANITDFPENFLPQEIAAISAIVGKNGCGKSTILNWLLERLIGGKNKREIGGIIAIKEGKTITLFHDIDIVKFPPSISPYNLKPIDIRIENYIDLTRLLAIPLVSGGEHFDIIRDDRALDEQFDYQKNISDRFLLVHDIENYRSNNTPIYFQHIGDCLNAYQIQNNLRICLLLLDPKFRHIDDTNHDGESELDIKLPPYIRFSPNTSAEENINSRIEELSKLRNRSTQTLKDAYDWESRFLNNVKKACIEINLNNMDDLKIRMLKQFLRAALFSFFYRLYSMPDSVSFFSNEMKDYLLGLFKPEKKRTFGDFIVWIDEHIEKLNNERRAIEDNSKNIHLLNYCLSFLDQLKDVLIFLSDKIKWKDGMPHINTKTALESNPSIAKELEKLMRSDIFATERFFNMFYSHHLPIISKLSDGERSILNLFSRIRYVWGHSNTNDYGVPSLLILDEVEVGFHPEWQRKFINRLMTFMSILASKNHPVQIIYTTHSPITLSDMPKECVNMIDGHGNTVEESNKIQTFGANVFDLYGDSFFMEKGLIGEFARAKIQEISREIEHHIASETMPDEKGLKLLRQRIKMVGDFRIKSYLMSRLEKIDPSIEIQMLEERLAILKNKNPYEKD